MSKIKEVKARQVLDCKGRPVAEVDIITEKGVLGRAGASTGSSVGANESFVLRDGDPNVYGGLSVYHAIDNIRNVIAPAIIGMDVQDQTAIDETMIALDGTRYKTKLGGNAIYAVSVAAAKAAAAENGKQIYQNMARKPISYIMSPSANVINGGTYNGKTQAFQEFMILPHGVRTIEESVRMIVEVFYHLDEVIRKYNGGKPAMGNYSGWGAPSDDPMQVLDIIAEAVNDLGFTDHMVYALDCASSEYYDAEKCLYRWRGDYVDRDFIIDQLAAISRKYPLAFVEDALQEEDFEGFKLASERINTVIVGDDFLCTSLDRAEKAVSMGAARGMIFKPNQAGTLTEALRTAKFMMDRGLLVIPSGRAGGTLDSPEKEIAVALGAWVTKTGAPRSGSRTNGFNFLLRTSEELGVPQTDVMQLEIFKHLHR